METERKLPAVTDRAKRKALRDTIKAELQESSMEPWAADLCRFVARQPDFRRFMIGSSVRRPLLEAATALADRPVKRAEMSRILISRPWLALWEKERGGLVDAEVKQAKEQFLTLVPKALDVTHKSLDHVTEILDGDDVVRDENGKAIGVRDKLGAIRTASPLVSKVLDTSIPRAQTNPQFSAQVINIHLTPEQQQGLSAPILTVEAEEILPQPPDVIVERAS